MAEYPDKTDFELVSPERLLVSESVDMVVVPGGEGDFGVLPGHTPMISTIRPGVIDVHDGGSVTRRIFISGGFAEVMPDRCTVLAEEAMPLEDVDRSDADARLKRAREEVEDALDEAERGAAEARLAVAEALVSHLGQG